MKMDTVDLSVKGWNYGQAKFEGKTIFLSI